MPRLDRNFNVKFDILQDENVEVINLKMILLLGEDLEFPAFEATNKPKGFKENELFRFYSSLDSMLGDGFAESSEIYKLAKFIFLQNSLSRVMIGRKLSSDSINASLNKIKNQNSNWYGLLIASKIKADILEVSEFAEINRKLFSGQTKDLDCLDSSILNDVISELKARKYEYVVCNYHNHDNERIDAGILAKFLASEPGSTFANYKTIIGATSSNIGEEQEITLESKFGNYYSNVANIPCYSDGFTASGKQIDVVRDRDYLKYKSQTDNFKFLKKLSDANMKIPYTDTGIFSLISSVYFPLIQDAIDRNILAKSEVSELSNTVGIPQADLINHYLPQFGVVLKYPKSSDVSSTDKAKKVLNGIELIADIAGSIEKISFVGKLLV